MAVRFCLELADFRGNLGSCGRISERAEGKTYLIQPPLLLFQHVPLQPADVDQNQSVEKKADRDEQSDQ